MGVPVIATVSEKRTWVEKTISSLDQGFDKKRLLESADALEDPELRSLVATSITASMAKRKLAQYLERLGSGDAPANEPNAHQKPPAPQAGEPREDGRSEDPIVKPRDPSASDTAGTADDPRTAVPLPTRFEAIRDSEVRTPHTAAEPSAARSSERFDRLEKTVLATKSKHDLTVPDIPEDMVATIRELKNLAQRKVEAPKYVEPKRASLRSDDLLEAFESEVHRSEPSTEVRGPDPTRSTGESEGVLPAQASHEDRADAADTLEEFEAFLSEPSTGMGGPQPVQPSEDRSSLFTASEVSEPTLPAKRAPDPAVPPPPTVPPPPPHTPRAPPSPKIPPVRTPPSAAPLPQTASALREPRSSEAAKAAPEPLEDITGHFDRLLATMGELNADLPAAAIASEAADAAAQRDAQAPAQRSATEPTARSPVPDGFPEPDHHEPYDGTWIEGCESIGDILDVLGQVTGSIEDVRTTVAFFVLGFSEELAGTIRTAQNRDELELMLRKALTATIDDAFERTATRFVHERESFAREAGVAADAFDESVVLAEEEARMRREAEARAERERLEAERVRKEAEERERAERARRESEERERDRREADDRARREAQERARLDAQAREQLRLEASREEVERAERERRSVERLAEEREALERAEHEQAKSAPSDERPLSGTELLASAQAIHERAESESAEDVTEPIVHPEKRTPTLAGRISDLIGTLHELIDGGSYDEALRALGEVRGLLARQIELKEHRSEPIIDERMADYELKALALDLEILKARE